MASTDLYAQASALLDACVTLLGSRAPSLSYVSPGAPAFDCCPMLTVHVPGFGEAGTAIRGALSGGHRHDMGRVNLTTLVVTIIRCDKQQPHGVPPLPADKEATASEVLEDAWTLWNGLNRMANDGTLFRDCGERFFDPARAIDSLGGCAGYHIQARVSIPGYDPLA